MIEFANVSKQYRPGIHAVRDINIRIEDGEFVFIMGRSGAGKSTLFRLITREILASEGRVIVNGRDLSRLRPREIPGYRRELGIVFQDFRLLEDRNVYENIAFAQRVVGASPSEIRKNVPYMMRLTGISSRYKSMPRELSGGEQQRTAIARALINRPSVILADEPTGNLDDANSEEIMKLLKEINDMGTTVVVITHSRFLAESSGKRVIMMEKGSVASDRIDPFVLAPVSAFADTETPVREHPKERGRSRLRPDLASPDVIVRASSGEYFDHRREGLS